MVVYLLDIRATGELPQASENLVAAITLDGDGEPWYVPKPVILEKFQDSMTPLALSMFDYF